MMRFQQRPEERCLYVVQTHVADGRLGLEDDSARGRLEEARPLVEQIESIGQELL
jgi:hypothetical protein